MSAFEPAFNHILDWEDRGCKGTVTSDDGGRTRYGIAEKFNVMPENFWTDPPDKALMLAGIVYRARYWEKFKLDEIADQAVANYIADCFVNPGPGTATIKMIQQAVNDALPIVNVANYPETVEAAGIATDGEWGPVTRNAINRCDPKAFLEALAKLREQHYRDRAAAEQRNEQYLNGWIARAEDTRIAVSA